MCSLKNCKWLSTTLTFTQVHDLITSQIFETFCLKFISIQKPTNMNRHLSCVDGGTLLKIAWNIEDFLFQLGGSVPNSLGRSGSPFSSRRNSNISNMGSQSSLCGSRKSSIASDCRNATPPTTPNSLLQQTFNNVVSAASSLRSSSPYRRPFARNSTTESMEWKYS